MVSTSGAQLLPENAVQTMIKELLPVTTILTPNLPEAKLLLKEAGAPFKEPTSVNDLVSLAQSVRNLGPEWVLLKGGHLPLTKDKLVPTAEADRHVVLNVLCGASETHLLETPYLDSRNTHGTGCSLACTCAYLTFA